MEVLTIFFISFLWLEARGENCPTLYERYSKQHTYCLEPNATCKIQKSQVKATEIDVILREHNDYRSRVATGAETDYSLPSASYMLQMFWDDELASVAQKHADQCVFEHDCGECRRVQNFDVGQNLYERRVSPDPPRIDWSTAVKAWYDEVKDFQKPEIKSFQNGEGPPPTGHFTQVIWAKSWRVGCGYTMYKEGAFYVELYTCNYGPAGNVKNTAIYEEGKPCSQCPENSCCGTSCPKQGYEGLCQISGDDNPPQYKLSEKAIFTCTFTYESDCARKTASGVDKWEIHNTLSGSYIGIVLQGGESSMLNFTNSFTTPKGQSAMCLISYFRKGPQVSGEDGTNEAFEIVRIPEINYQFSPKLQSNSGDFIKLSVTLNWVMETMLSISFSVPAGKPPQFLEIKDITVIPGTC